MKDNDAIYMQNAIYSHHFPLDVHLRLIISNERAQMLVLKRDKEGIIGLKINSRL